MSVGSSSLPQKRKRVNWDWGTDVVRADVGAENLVGLNHVGACGPRGRVGNVVVGSSFVESNREARNVSANKS